MKSKTSAATKTEENLSFEEALAELEKITRELENGSTSLEDSIALYERGVLLRTICEKKLKDAEGRWMILKKNKDGQTVQEEIPAGKIPEPNDLSDSIF